MEDPPQKICHTTGETYICDQEFERKRRTNVCNRADVEDSPHNGDRLGSRGVGSGGLRSGGLRSTRPHPPGPNPPYPNPPDPTYHRCVANLPHRDCCKRLSDGYAQILGHIRCVANLPSGKSSGNPIYTTMYKQCVQGLFHKSCS